MKTFVSILAVSVLVGGVLTQSDPQACANNLKPGCTICAESIFCLRCAAGYKIVKTQTGQQISQVCTLCANGLGRAADQTDQYESTTCSSNLDLTSKCNVYGATPTTCVTCKAGYHMSSEGMCTACPNGRGKGIDSSPPTVTVAGQENTACSVECTPSKSCGFCTGNPDVCLGCNDGKYLDSSQSACIACTTGCAACTGAGLTKCSKCSDNFYYSATDTCTACPVGKFRTAPTLAPTNPESEDICTVPAPAPAPTPTPTPTPTNPGNTGTTGNVTGNLTNNTTGNVTGNNSNSTNNSSSSKATTIFQVIFGAIIGTLALQ